MGNACWVGVGEIFDDMAPGVRGADEGEGGGVINTLNAGGGCQGSTTCNTRGGGFRRHNWGFGCWRNGGGGFGCNRRSTAGG